MMFKTIAAGLMLAGLLLQPAAARTLDEVRADGTLKVVTTASSPPHGFKNPASNQLEGIMVDVAAGVAKRLKLKAAYTEVPFSGLIPTLTSGRADLMSGPLFITPERAKVVDFSVPVYEWGEGVVVSDKAAKPYTKFEDMQGKRVGVLVDSVQFNMIKDMPGTKVSTYPDYVTLIADVRAGRIDLGVVDPPSIIYQIKSKGISGVKLDTAYQPQKKWQVGMAVDKGNTALLQAVNQALGEMKSSGEMAEIGRKWGVSDLLAK
ncbi:amino acid ABC transporter substrate-binding protein [Bordetella genomosp. 10]|uniref:Amino acid ABC transporter substrate-binding protein n=1 Tax=Bordetella genomosp. 10 TaxID=1416804 RepID=A0A261S1J2_9BORD|nr:ABC transporter substrate-binding protein [Bordetella genomosp. 10]OZI31214.1 amino acid ABC transporter substrate-binding protein [Bordetella genomosp. 10]